MEEIRIGEILARLLPFIVIGGFAIWLYLQITKPPPATITLAVS